MSWVLGYLCWVIVSLLLPFVTGNTAPPKNFIMKLWRYAVLPGCYLSLCAFAMFTASKISSRTGWPTWPNTCPTPPTSPHHCTRTTHTSLSPPNLHGRPLKLTSACQPPPDLLQKYRTWLRRLGGAPGG